MNIVTREVRGVKRVWCYDRSPHRIGYYWGTPSRAREWEERVRFKTLSAANRTAREQGAQTESEEDFTGDQS